MSREVYDQIVKASELKDRYLAERDEALDVLEELAQYVGGWDSPLDHPCGKAAALLARYNRPK